MASPVLVISAATVLAICFSAYFFHTRFWNTPKKLQPQIPTTFPEPPPYIKELAKELPASVLLPKDVAAFQGSMNALWSQQNRDMLPGCIVQPRDTKELSIAVIHLKQEHSVRAQQSGRSNGLFGIRGGGANPAYGISGVKDGVVLDLSLLNEVTPSQDGQTVVVGAGAYWAKVYKELEKRNLGVVGGRASPVGVGGSTLQGGISFHSPKYGFICSNVLSYEVVLADGTVVTASADENPDLWRALKGGSNNFGVVSRFTYKTFSMTKIWAGSYIGPSFESVKTFKAFHQYVNHASDPKNFDERAAGPILSVSYIANLNFSILHNHMAYTEPSPTNDWPQYWKESPFRSFWRFRSRFKNQTLHDAVTYLGDLTPAGFRNIYGTTTIKNDEPTILAMHQIWQDNKPLVKHVKDAQFILIMQPILPQWMTKGQPHIFGLEDCKEPLIVVSFSVSWSEPKDDKLMKDTVRKAMAEIEEVAIANNAAHPYRFMNYATEWQRPLDGYGKKNLDFLREVSQKYDPDGLFQTGCIGGFKLNTTAGDKEQSA